MRRLLVIGTAVIVVESLFGLQAQVSASRNQVLHTKQLMTPSEFKACGLEKLSAQELKRLDAWLQSYTVRVLEVLGETSAGSTPDVIESHIDGQFEGWDGETIFKLENGQIWQQSSYAYTYHYAYRPEVIIYKTRGGWKMKVDGVDDTIYVKRLK